MKPIRLLGATLVPLCALALGIFWLQSNVDAATLPPTQDRTAVGTEIESAAVGSWPPLHQDLSRSPEKDSGSADIDADRGVVAVVWAEGSSAQGLNDGRVKIAWRKSTSSEWRIRVVPLQIDGFAHYQPAVAVRGQNAHVVWARKDVEGPGMGNNRISYSHCRLDTGICTAPVGVSPEGGAYLRLAPDVAVDAAGDPHVVWVRQNHQQIGRILYNNRKDDVWNDDTPEVVSGGGPDCFSSQDNPAIALDSQRIYVVWDENEGTCSPKGTAGIYFRQRNQVARPSGTGTWSPEGSPWGKQLSVAPPNTPFSPENVDGFPTLDAGGGQVYVMWERLAVTQTLPLYGAVYTYTLPYRVYTGTTAASRDWWPGGMAADQWAVLPFTSTSATDLADFYEGLRPSLEMVGPVPHVVWHQWTAPKPDQLAQLEPQDELPDEYLVDDRFPYRAAYATYRPGTNSRNLFQAQSRWVSQTLQAVGADRIFSSPDLALSSLDGGKTYDLHVAMHRRGVYVPQDDSFGWDVWYTNNDTFFSHYLPVLLIRTQR